VGVTITDVEVSWGGGGLVFEWARHAYVRKCTRAGIHWPMSNGTDVACIKCHQQVDGTSMETSAKAEALQISCNLSKFSAVIEKSVCVIQNVNN
jgi:hypothetical protein